MATSYCASWPKTSFLSWRSSATASWRHLTSPHLEHALDHDSHHSTRHRYRCCRPRAGSDDAAEQEARRSVGDAKDVGKLLGSEFSAAEFDDLRNELASAGFLAKGKRNTFVLTDVGRERALRFLGVSELPSQTKWSTVIAKYLFPKAAGLSADAAAKLKNGDKLAAFVLKRKYGLAAGAGSTVNQVLEAVACKQLGFPDETTLDGPAVCGSESAHGIRAPAEETACQAAPALRDGLDGRQGRWRAQQGGDGTGLAANGSAATIRATRTAPPSRVRPDRLCRDGAGSGGRAARPRIGSTTTRCSSRPCGGQASGSRTSRAFPWPSSSSDWSRRTRRIYCT